MSPLKDIVQVLSFKEVLDNIVVSVVSGSFLSLLAALLHVQLPDIAVLLFWKRYAKDLAVIPSGIQRFVVEPELRPGSRPILLTYGEVVAVSDLLHFFRVRCKANPRLAALQSAADFDRLKDQNLFIVGGPKDNRAAEMFLREIDMELYYQFKRLLPGRSAHEIDKDLKVLVGKTAAYPDLTYDAGTQVQYGTIVFRKDLYAFGKSVLCAAGLDHTSTLAAVNWVCSRPGSFWLRTRMQAKGFQAVIRCRVLDQTKVSKLELVVLRELG